MSATPYILSQGLWHKLNENDGSRLVCGAATPKDTEVTLGRPTICPGCEKEFPASSLVSTHEANLRIWKTAIACAATEDKREEILKWHKLAIAAARALGIAETRLAYESRLAPGSHDSKDA